MFLYVMNLAFVGNAFAAGQDREDGTQVIDVHGV